MTSGFRLAADALLAPSRYAARASVDEAVGVARGMLALLWVAWGALLVALTADGHAPSGPILLPVARAHAYLVQAVVTGPLFAISGAAAAAAGARLLVDRVQDRRIWRAHVTTSITTSALLVIVLPDAILFAVLGFEGLTRAAPVVLPAFLVVLIARQARLARVTQTVTRRRALLVSCAIALTHLVVTGPFVR